MSVEFYRGSPGKFDSRTLSRETLSRWTGRTTRWCRGFDFGIILILRGGIPGPTGNSPESLSQAILAGIISVGRLGVIWLRTNGVNTNGAAAKEMNSGRLGKRNAPALLGR